MQHLPWQCNNSTNGMHAHCILRYAIINDEIFNCAKSLAHPKSTLDWQRWDQGWIYPACRNWRKLFSDHEEKPEKQLGAKSIGILSFSFQGEKWWPHQLRRWFPRLHDFAGSRGGTCRKRREEIRKERYLNRARSLSQFPGLKPMTFIEKRWWSIARSLCSKTGL